jgi:hypothetical protein
MSETGADHDTPPAEDAARADGRTAVRWTGAVMIAATLALALVNAESARNWSEGFPPSPAGHALRLGCERWADLTQKLGLQRPRALAQTGWKALHDLKWSLRGR